MNIVTSLSRTRIVSVVLLVLLVGHDTVRCDAQDISDYFFVDLPSLSEAGYPSCVASENENPSVLVGFEKGSVRRFDIESRKQEILTTCDGKVFDTAVDSKRETWAVAHASADGESIELKVGDFPNRSLQRVKSFDANSFPGRDEDRCSLEFSKSGGLVAYFVRLNGGRETYFGIVECGSNTQVFDYGPFDSSYRYVWDDLHQLIQFTEKEDAVFAFVDRPGRT